MARLCVLTGKRTQTGNNRPFSLKATRRTFRPNLFWKRVVDPATGRVQRLRLSAKALRTLKKWAKQDLGVVQSPEVAKATTTKNRVKKEHLTPKQKKDQKATKHQATETPTVAEVSPETPKKQD